MGQGRDMARQLSPDAPHHDLLENFRDQLLIVLLKRLAKDGCVDVPVAEVDNTGGDIVAFSVRDGVFRFELQRKS